MRKKIIVMSAILSIVLTACGTGSEKSNTNVYEYGDIQTQTPAPNKGDDNSEAGLPTYDPMSATQALTYPPDRKMETKTSYYKEQLGSNARKAFDALYYAADEYNTNIELSGQQLITPAELEKVMHVLFLDCPELFWLEPVYSYHVRTDASQGTGMEKQNVDSVTLYFSMTADEAESIREGLARKKPDVLQSLKDNDYSNIQGVAKNVMDTSIQYGSVAIGRDGDYDFSCMKPFQSSKLNSIGISKLVMYWMRESGIDCTIALGEPVSPTLSQSNELITDYLNFKEIQGEGDFYTVRYNYSCYWAWNLVKIDSQWYNYDYAYSLLLSDLNKLDRNRDTLLFSTDLLMSQTRLSYMNEEIIGMMPSCTDNNFLRSYREGWYVLPLTETQSLRKLQEILSDCDSKNSATILLQCGDEATFNYLTGNFEEQLENYNTNRGNPIGSYKTKFIRDSLIFCVYDIVHNY